MTGSRRFPPFAKPGSPVTTASTVQDDLPSINSFLDELPPIEDFLVEREDFREAEPSVVQPQVSVDSSAEGWASGDWQSYDWSSLSSLNRAPQRTGAAEAWGESEWPGEDTQARDTTQQHSSTATPSADEIADALDGIARRLRSGELMIDKLHGMPPEAAMAAALAVLLRMRG